MNMFLNLGIESDLEGEKELSPESKRGKKPIIVPPDLQHNRASIWVPSSRITQVAVKANLSA